MKAVMLSIRPEWCEKILSGKKTVEIRKSRPMLEVPFKCYIYCTSGSPTIWKDGEKILKGSSNYEWLVHTPDMLNGKVIGEFVCDEIVYLGNVSTDPWRRLCGAVHEHNKMIVTKRALLTETELHNYANGKFLYAWHISDLVIYDKPQPVNFFCSEGDCDCMNCRECPWYERGNGYNVEDDCGLVYEYLGSGKTLKPLFRPPQSWCYVEDLT